MIKCGAFEAKKLCGFFDAQKLWPIVSMRIFLVCSRHCTVFLSPVCAGKGLVRYAGVCRVKIRMVHFLPRPLTKENTQKTASEINSRAVCIGLNF
jgi:hypothetical protein